MENNTLLGSRKFYKLRSLSCCLQQSSALINNIRSVCYNGTLKNESELSTNGIKNIDKDTILFITASNKDTGKYIRISSYEDGIDLKSEPSKNNYLLLNEGDTVLWIKGEFYSLSSKGIKDIEEDNGSLNISYSNGSNKTISLESISGGYNAIYPIIIDDGNIILDGLYIDGENNNMKTFDNSIGEGIKNSYVEGVGNKSTVDYQHIMGKYAKPDNNSIFIIGGGEKSFRNIDLSKNLFTVGFDGTATAEKDVIIKKEKIGDVFSGKDIKLSDIHNVVDEDWVVVEKLKMP
jgi:hypothetical protein